MKIRKFFVRILIVSLAFVAIACGDPIGETDFDAYLLYGKWENNGVFERYDRDGTGATWDTNDDVTEDEAQPFEWTLDGARLYQEHKMWNGAIVPKTFTLTRLTSTSLEYKDDYGEFYNFVKR